MHARTVRFILPGNRQCEASLHRRSAGWENKGTLPMPSRDTGHISLSVLRPQSGQAKRPVFIIIIINRRRSLYFD